MKYSIILPVRNGGQYVKECVNSILAQTVTDFNLHILDNCSTDGTSEWLQTLNDPRIVIYPADRSLSITENWARIKDIPKNEFMTMIGHDDVLYPSYLAEMEVLIEKHPEATLYQAHYRYIDGKGLFIRNCLPMDEKQYAHEFLACQMMRILDSMGTGYMMRSADYDSLEGIPTHYPNLMFADYQLWVCLIWKGYKAASVKETFAYRIHNNTSLLADGMIYQDAFGQYVAFLATLRKDDSLMQITFDRYCKDFLLYSCESLSHRLLKTPIGKRTVKVSDFIEKCKAFAQVLIPGQSFEPEKLFRIELAKRLDRYTFTRNFFNLIRPIIIRKKS